MNRARAVEVMIMLSKDFVEWVILAFVLAMPVAKTVKTALRRDLSLPKSLTLIVKSSYTWINEAYL